MGWLTKRRLIPLAVIALLFGILVGFWCGVWFSYSCLAESWHPHASLYLRLVFLCTTPAALVLIGGLIGRACATRRAATTSGLTRASSPNHGVEADRDA